MAEGFWKGFGIATLIFILIFGIVFLFQFRTGKVVTDFPKTLKIGEEFEAELFISIEDGDSLSKDSKVLVTIDKDGVAIEAEVVTLGEFIELSDNPVEPIRSGDGFYYQTVGTYRVQLTKIMKYKFSEIGDYDVSLMILSEDIEVSEKFSVV